MTLRLFLANAAAPYTPPTIRGTWSDKALTGASYLSRRKTGAGTTAAKAETSNSSTWAVLLRRFVTETVNNPGTISGAFTIVFGALESNAAANDVVRLHMFVTVGNTDVVRGVLTSLALDGSVEWPVTAFASEAAGVGAAGTLTPVAVLPGDRIVLEIGFKAANTVTTSYTGTLYYGGTATDLTVNDQNVTTRPGWVEFADASVSAAFAGPFRTGATTTTLGPVSSVIHPGKMKDAATTTTVGVTSTQLQGYKVVKTVTGNVRPPGRPPGHPPDPETGVVTTGIRYQSSGLLASAPKPAISNTAARVASTTAESLTTMHARNVPYAVLEGDHDTSPLDIDLLTAPPPPTPQGPLKFIAQDIRTHRFLSYELPLIDVSLTWTLSGPTMMSATLHPESPTLSELGITAWATWIHVEQDGQLLASMILQPTRIDGENYTVEAMGFSGYAQGMPFFSEDLLVAFDAADVMRRIWNHLQSFPDARLGVVVDNTMSGLLLGIPAQQSVDADGTLQFDDVVTSEVTIEIPDEDVRIISQVRDPNTGIVVVRWNDGYEVTRTPKMDDAVPYVISWYSDTDCGQEFDNLAKTAKMDYREVVRWATEGDIAVIPVTERRIELGYPRLGRKRYDLRVAQDENMIDAIPLEEATGAQGYASQVLARGAGEGRNALRGYAGLSDPHRIRRVAIVSDGTLMNQTATNTLAEDEILRRLAAITIGQAVIMDWHPNAPLGSYQVGDEVLITGFVPWAGYVEFWHRIIAFTWEPSKNIVTLNTRRAEQFGYGRPVPNPQPAPDVPSGDGESDVIT